MLLTLPLNYWYVYTKIDTLKLAMLTKSHYIASKKIFGDLRKYILEDILGRVPNRIYYFTGGYAVLGRDYFVHHRYAIAHIYDFRVQKLGFVETTDVSIDADGDIYAWQYSADVNIKTGLLSKYNHLLKDIKDIYYTEVYFGVYVPFYLRSGRIMGVRGNTIFVKYDNSYEVRVYT